MVLLHFKRSDQNQFLYETTTAIAIDKLVEELVASKLSHIVWIDFILTFSPF